MSGPDEAEGEKGFLARWSQRKQEAKQPEPKPDAAAAESVESGSPAPQAEDAAPKFDLSTLPKLEELTGSTDITAFLRKGVPEHLRNAALQKSWALDPAIRNYVSPALEYAYDWNAPGGVPGGGELGAGVDVARLVSQIMGEPAAEPTSSGTSSNASSESSSASNSADETPHSPVEPFQVDLPAKPQVDVVDAVDVPEQSLRLSGEPVAEKEVVSKAGDDAGEPVPPDQSLSTRPVAPQQPVRRHGTAKPIV